MANKAKIQCIPGVCGDVEIRHLGVTDTLKPLVLIAHPHPQHGGTFDNKVVTTIERMAQKQNYATVVFNYRGVGRSQGQFDHARGEVDDAMAVLRWALQWQPKERAVCLAGFSFGSFIVHQLAHRCATQDDFHSLQRLLLVAPPHNLYTFHSHPLSVPITLIQGGADDVVPVGMGMTWAQQHRWDTFYRAEADHFFHGQLRWLRQMVGCWLA